MRRMTPAVHVVNTPDVWERLLWMLRAAEWVSFDVETTSGHGGLEDWHDDSRIVSVAFATTPDEAWVMPLAHPENEHGVDPHEVFDSLVGSKIIGHNVKFDARWAFRYAGVDLSPYLAWDTMATAYLLDENASTALKTVAPAVLGVEPWDDLDAKKSPHTVPLDQLATYNGLDAVYTLQLAEKQRADMRDQFKQPGGTLAKVLWHVLMPAIRALTAIEQEGMILDLEYVQKLSAENAVEIQRLERALLDGTPRDLLQKYARNGVGQQSFFDEGGEVVPDVSWAPTSKFFLEYVQRAKWPVMGFTRDKQGKETKRPSWKGAFLKRVAQEGYADAGLLAKQRTLTKQQDAFLTPWQALAAGSGRLYPSYHPTRFEDVYGDTSGTVTGRISSSGPNMQQVPKALKPAFPAEDGWGFLQADASQIEVRLAGEVSGDAKLRKVYLRNGDVYRETAAGIRQTSPDEISADDRQRTKPVVLGFLYGMGAHSFVDYARDTYDVLYEEWEAVEVRKGFFDLYPGLLDWHERVRRFVQMHGYTTSKLGRIRRVPLARTGDKHERGRAERQAINAEIQSFASDLLLMALDRIRREIPRDEFRSAGTVHDQVMGYVRLDVAEDVARRIGEIMVTPDLSPFDYELSVPLAADVEVGPRWGASTWSTTIRSTDFVTPIGQTMVA